MRDTLPLLLNSDFPAMDRLALNTLQVNITLQCNQQCVHCHVNASPKRREFMTTEVINTVIQVLSRHKVGTLDITGGAPELHPEFRRLVVESRRLGCRVIDRCNLTILLEDGFEDLAHFLAAQQVDIIASLPCYLEDNVDRQRGQGVFLKSIAALRHLNTLGYGNADETLPLHLVYNPQGAQLPPEQVALEQTYKQQLWQRYGICFNQLLVLCNMPIKRFGSQLLASGEFPDYMQLLRQSHCDANVAKVMCRDLISVDWQGRLYDCDFNQMLDLPIKEKSNKVIHIKDLLGNFNLKSPIFTAAHCYGCTAGQGSSCGGALTDTEEYAASGVAI